MNESQQLTVIERASLALQSSEHEKRLIEMTNQSAEIITITNIAGYDQCHSVRMTFKNIRVAIEKIGKTAREDAKNYCKAVIAEKDRLIAIGLSEENRLQALQEAWDAAREAERQAKLKAEMERVRNIKEMIELIRNEPATLINKPSEIIRSALEHHRYTKLLSEVFEEFLDEAELIKAQSILTIEALLTATVHTELEKERIQLEREELARLRAEQERATAEERERLAQENARIAAERRNEEDRLKAIRDAEETRVAIIRKAEQDLLDAENRRLQEERAKLAKEREEIEAEKRQQEAIILAAKEEEERKIRDQVAEITRQREELEKQKIEQEFREKLIAERKEALDKSRCGSAEEALQKILDICNNHLDYQYPEEIIDAIELIASATLKVPV